MLKMMDLIGITQIPGGPHLEKLAARGVFLVCFWCAFGVVLVCFWCVFGVFLVCFWTKHDRSLDLTMMDLDCK